MQAEFDGREVTFWCPADFLERLRKGLNYPHGGGPGQLAFTREVGLIIEGPCSHMEHRTWFDCSLLGNEQSSMEFTERLSAERPQSVLMFARCCGSYQPQFQASIKEAFPDINWWFPSVPDLNCWLFGGPGGFMWVKELFADFSHGDVVREAA